MVTNLKTRNVVKIKVKKFDKTSDANPYFLTQISVTNFNNEHLIFKLYSDSKIEIENNND